MKKFIILILILAIGFLGFLCIKYFTQENITGPKLNISYGGRTIDREIAKDDVIKIETTYYNLEVTVKDIKDDYVLIETNKKLTEELTNGNINTQKGVTEHKIYKNVSTNLRVPVQDATIKYTFLFKK